MTRTEAEKLSSALAQFRTAFRNLHEVWNQVDHTGDLLAEKYPLDHDFSSINIGVQEWADYHITQLICALPITGDHVIDLRKRVYDTLVRICDKEDGQSRDIAVHVVNQWMEDNNIKTL